MRKEEKDPHPYPLPEGEGEELQRLDEATDSPIAQLIPEGWTLRMLEQV